VIIILSVLDGQHDGHLPFRLPGFVNILLLLHVLFAVAEINILLLLIIVVCRAGCIISWATSQLHLVCCYRTY